MIGYVTIGSSDIDASCRFYDAALAPLGYARTFSEGGWAGYGPGGKKEGFEIYLVQATANGEPATYGNGSMLAFKAPSREAVDALYAAALANGGSDEGGPGVRGENTPPFYGAYVRDPTGNKFAAYFKG